MTDYADLRKRLDDDARWMENDGGVFTDQCAAILREASAAIAALVRERDEARLDKARLDWLDSANQRLNAKHGTHYKWQVILNHNVARLMLGDMQVDLHDTDPNGLPSCRDAIDAALHARISPPPSVEGSKDDGKDTE